MCALRHGKAEIRGATTPPLSTSFTCRVTPSFLMPFVYYRSLLYAAGNTQASRMTFFSTPSLTVYVCVQKWFCSLKRRILDDTAALCALLSTPLVTFV